MPADPILVVLLCTAIAAAAAAAGVLPYLLLGRVPIQALGCAYAVASGLMLGAGYLLMAEGLRGTGSGPVVLMAGAGVGVAYTYWTHWFSGTGSVQPARDGEVPAALGFQILLMNALHSASEGVAIGVAMVVNLKMGVFLAFSLALHNIAEAVTLASVLQKRNLRLGESAVLCVVTNVPQMLLAVSTFAVVGAARGMLPAALGFASGALVYLVLTELLPASYKQANDTAIAAVVSFSAGIVVLLKNFLG